MKKREFLENLKKLRKPEVTKSCTGEFIEKYEWHGSAFGWIQNGTRFMSKKEAVQSYIEIMNKKGL